MKLEELTGVAMAMLLELFTVELDRVAELLLATEATALLSLNGIRSVFPALIRLFDSLFVLFSSRTLTPYWRAIVLSVSPLAIL